MPRPVNEKRMPAARSWLGTDAAITRHVHVFGGGYFSTATRLELVRLGIHRDTDYLLPALQPPLLIACGDSESDASFNDAAAHAMQEGAPLLLACLLERVIRIGPLIEPGRAIAPASKESSLASRQRTVPDGTEYPARTLTRQTPLRIAESGSRLSLFARLGALLVGAQTLSFLLGERRQCVLDRVVELNPWSMESKGYRVIKVRQ